MSAIGVCKICRCRALLSDGNRCCLGCEFMPIPYDDPDAKKYVLITGHFQQEVVSACVPTDQVTIEQVNGLRHAHQLGSRTEIMDKLVICHLCGWDDWLLQLRPSGCTHEFDPQTHGMLRGTAQTVNSSEECNSFCIRFTD